MTVVTVVIVVTVTVSPPVICSWTRAGGITFASGGDTVPVTFTTAATRPVITSSPVLCVWFAAKLRTLFALVSNWPGIGGKAEAQTLRVKGVGEAGDTVAVTVLIPRFSGMDV